MLEEGRATRSLFLHLGALQDYSQCSSSLTVLVPQNRTLGEENTYSCVFKRFFSRSLQERECCVRTCLNQKHLGGGVFVIVDRREAKLGLVQNKRAFESIQFSCFFLTSVPTFWIYCAGTFLHPVSMNRCSYDFLLLLYQVS